MKNRVNYKEFTDDELKTKLVELKAALFNLRFSHKAGQLTSPMELPKTRKEIARVLTEAGARKLDVTNLGLTKGKKALKKPEKEMKKTEAKKETKKAEVKKSPAAKEEVKPAAKKTTVKKESK